MIFEIFGIFGVVAIVVAYFLLQAGKFIADDLAYIILNIVGALGILISLSNNFNLSATLMEIAWLIIGFFGLARFFYLRRKD
jgi:paired small multidrug resistance pump